MNAARGTALVTALLVALVAPACGFLEPREVWDPDGADQIIEYRRNRGAAPTRVGIWIQGPMGTGGGVPLAGGFGCTSVGYPWVLKVGPRGADPATYQPILDSGNVTHGTITIWTDVAPDGRVTAGFGRPEWATTDAPGGCGAPAEP